MSQVNDEIAEEVANEIARGFGGNPSDFMMVKGVAIDAYIERTLGPEESEWKQDTAP